jgi:AcrR family transcriptional regulator
VTVQGDATYRSRRLEWTRAAILDAAWNIARRDGVAALSLREVAAGVGMRAPSLYHHFSSKAALLDAMYAQGMRQFAEHVEASPAGSNEVEALRHRAKAFVAAAVAEPARFDLLFQRPIPGFEPSPEHVQYALTILGGTKRAAAAAGIRTERAFDLFMATIRGLIAMQIANEPDGDRWTRLVDEAVDILTAHFGGRSNKRSKPTH